ncbi:MAG: MgtC/SapB family protein [Planctomycetota bacterium]|jgi:putative Mg2+ transporter-C (MgtC) family protein
MEILFEQIDFYAFVPLVTAVVLGGLIGLEREIHQKPAGLRTNILICMGAATFMVIANRMSASPDTIGRITAGIVAGVGFIGGGAVLRDHTSVYGITTAATIWVVTSIGIACGMMLYDIAVAVTLLSLLVLTVLNPLDRRIHKTRNKAEGKHTDHD